MVRFHCLEQLAPADEAYAAAATLSRRGVITRWSEGAEQLLGYRQEEVLGRPAVGLLANPAGEDRRPQSLISRHSWSGTVVLQHRDGHPLEVGLLAHQGVTDGDVVEWFLMAAVPQEPSPRPGEGMTVRGFDQAPCVLAIFDTQLRLVRANVDMETAVAMKDDQMRGMRPP
ncbi:PAS domain-containing protein [Streptomyces viridochromogenes]|uniref:PAS domain-containing protein n=1 Tax=Streptomyces viridochromogenes TaxID=1938 RepID=UPI000A730E7C